MVGILKCSGEVLHKVVINKAKRYSATATYQAILKMYILLLKVWKKDFSIVFGTIRTMF